MYAISSPATRKDHLSKITGNEKYTGDIKFARDGSEILSGRILRSPFAHGKLLSVKIPDLPEGYSYISADDAPRNVCYYPCNDLPADTDEETREMIRNGTPIFAKDMIEFAGQPIGMFIGPDFNLLKKLADETVLEYEEFPPVVKLEKASDVMLELKRSYGNPDADFLNADFVYEETISTGRQYQAYLETQTMIAEPEGEDRILIHGSLQCPFTLRESVAYSMDCDPSKIHICQNPTGGAFGGKEDFPSYIAPMLAVAVKKLNRAVRLTLDRQEDIQV